VKICIAYSQRLGDIIRILPIARHFAADGNEVHVECLAQYHDFFDCVSYCRPSLLRERADHDFGMLLDLEIWPKRFDEFVSSGQTWLDFVYGSDPLLAGIERKPVFDLLDTMPSLADYGLAPDIGIFSPFGYSQRDRYTLQTLTEWARDRICRPFVTLADPSHAEALARAGIAKDSILTARRSSHLPRLLRDARSVFTINSAPAIICGAVRSSFFHVLSGDTQNDTICDASRIV
jgi:hypothetical protein